MLVDTVLLVLPSTAERQSLARRRCWRTASRKQPKRVRNLLEITAPRCPLMPLKICSVPTQFNFHQNSRNHEAFTAPSLLFVLVLVAFVILDTLTAATNICQPRNICEPNLGPAKEGRHP